MTSSHQACGTNLAEHGVIPAKLGQWSAALADVLEVHTMAIDLEDPAARDEVLACVSLANRFRALAAELQATAEEMFGDRRIPTPHHDRDVLYGARAEDAFRGLVERERELAALFRAELARDERHLSDLITKREP